MENVTGLKRYTEDMDVRFIWRGRGAFLSAVKSTRGVGGAVGSENAGMSNHKRGENPLGRKSKVS